jgi:putative flippase GtrA
MSGQHQRHTAIEHVARPSRATIARLKPHATNVKLAGTRLVIFNAVGLIGLLVQFAILWVLREWLGFHYLLATALAVEAAILHNFVWHARWTWADRKALEWRPRLVRFNLTNGAISILGNVILAGVLVEVEQMDYLLANLIGVTACSLANFVASDRLVFAKALGIAVLCTVPIAGLHAADLRAESALAFDRYTRQTEARLDEEARGEIPFLWLDRLPETERANAYAAVHRGETYVSRQRTRVDGTSIRFPDALCHHWIGAVFVPGVAVHRVVTFMQSYDRYAEIYRPNVRRSRTLWHDGNRYKVCLQLFQKKIVSVVLNTEQDVTYVPVTVTRIQVRSSSTRIAEVAAADTSEEREQPVGRDNGFLWRFNNYCSIEERDQGSYVQCESVSLSRDIPIGLGWLIQPFVSSVPRESLEFTLGTIRKALVAGV